MWSKSFAGFSGGLLISISAMVTMYLLVPLEVDVRIMLGLILGWLIWAGVMVWCYASENGRQAWKRCCTFLTVSVILNTALFFTIS